MTTRIDETSESLAGSRLELLVREQNTAVLIEDAQRRIVITNQSFCDLFNIPVQPEDLVGFDCKRALDDARHFFTDAAGFAAGVERLLDDRVKVSGDLLEMVDGRWVSRSYIPTFLKEEYQGHIWVYAFVQPQQSAKKLSGFGDTYQDSLTAFTANFEKECPSEEVYRARLDHIRRDYFAGSQDRLVLVFKMFLEYAEQYIDTAREAMNQEDRKAMAQAVHKLRPVLPMVGLDHLFDDAKAIEDELNSSSFRMFSGVQSRFERFVERLNGCKPYIRNVVDAFDANL
jgi:HPt (histidine-containing phosphotransfer) domain-containing protein